MINSLIPRKLYAVTLPEKQVPKYIVLGQTMIPTSGSEPSVFVLENQDRTEHMYVCGTTGSGKSRFLENMIIQDIALDHPLCVIDPTGGLYSKILDFIAHCIEQSRFSKWNQNGFTPEEINQILEKYLFLNIDDRTNPLRINPLEPNEFETTEEMVDDLLKVTERLFGNVDEMRRLRQTLRNTFWTIAELNALPRGKQPSLPDGYSFPLSLSFSSKFLTLSNPDRNHLVQAIEECERNVYVKEYWTDFFSRYGNSQAQERLESTWNILQYFLGDSLVRRFFNCQRSTFHIAKLIRERKSLFCNLPLGKNLKGSQLIGTFLATKYQHAAYRRSLAEREHPYYLYVDEFHEIADMEYAKAMTTLRQYGLRMVNSHQSQDQPPFHTAEGRSILETIKGNSSVKVLFRLSRKDAETLAPEMFELTQKKFHFKYAERSSSVGESESVQKTVSFQHTTGITKSWTRSQTESLGRTDTIALQTSKGTNIGQTLTEGIGSTVAEGLSKSISESESRGITEAWSKQHGISVAIGEGWSHMTDHKTGFTYSENSNESLAVQRGQTQTHTTGQQSGETTTEGNSFALTETSGHSLTNTAGQSVSYHGPKGSPSESSGTNMGEMRQVANANSQSYSKALQQMKSVTDAIARNKSETRTTGSAINKGFQVGKGERFGLSGNRAETSSESWSHQRGTKEDSTRGKSEGESLTLSKANQTSLAEAFSQMKQVSETMSEALLTTLSKASSEGLSRLEQVSQGEGYGSSHTFSTTTSAGERLVFYTLEGERELNIESLQTLKRRNCVVSKTALGAQEIQTVHIPDGYFSYWDDDLPSEILRRQRERWPSEKNEKENPIPIAEELPMRFSAEPGKGDPFGF